MSSADLYGQMAEAAAQTAPAAGTALFGRAPAVILYGAGGAGRDALRVLIDAGVPVQCFLDRGARAGDRRETVPVLLPDDPALGPETRKTVPVVITVFNPHVDGSEVAAGLHRLGWVNVIPFLDFHRAFVRELGNRCWLTDLGFYRDRAPQMRAAASLWQDERSRAIYDAVLRYRWRHETDPVLAPDSAQSYFPADIPPWRTPGRFVDCGAYDGDTLEQIRARRFPLAAVAAFEPDPAHLGKLSETLRELGAAEPSAEALLWPCAVHSSTTRLRFADGLGMASALGPDGQEIVQAIALDDALPGFRPTLIKMDIEGAEHDALLGARALIHAHRPGLAICVYHRPQHVWQLPLLIDSWDLGYRFWLRAHGYNGYDLVLYAQSASDGGA